MTRELYSLPAFPLSQGSLRNRGNYFTWALRWLALGQASSEQCVPARRSEHKGHSSPRLDGARCGRGAAGRAKLAAARALSPRTAHARSPAAFHPLAARGGVRQITGKLHDDVRPPGESQGRDASVLGIRKSSTVTTSALSVILNGSCRVCQPSRNVHGGYCACADRTSLLSRSL